MKKKELPQVEDVKLKTLFGMKPGIWLTVLYAAVFLVLLFLVGFLPGIKNGGKRVSFSSKNEHVNVYINGNYVGRTPFETFVKSGNYSVEFKVGDIVLESAPLKVAHPVFFTWLFPRKQDVRQENLLTAEAFDYLTGLFYSDAATYASVLSYDNVYHYKPLFTEYASASVHSFSDECEDNIIKALCFVTTKEMADDVQNAFEILGKFYDLSAVRKTAESYNSILPAEYEGFSSKGSDSLKIGDFTVLGIKLSNGNSISSSVVPSGLVKKYFKENAQDKSGFLSYDLCLDFCRFLSNLSGKNVFIPYEEEVLSSLAKDDENLYFTSTYYIPDVNKAFGIQTVLEKYGINANRIVVSREKRGVVTQSMENPFASLKIGWN